LHFVPAKLPLYTASHFIPFTKPLSFDHAEQKSLGSSGLGGGSGQGPPDEVSPPNALNKLGRGYIGDMLHMKQRLFPIEDSCDTGAPVIIGNYLLKQLNAIESSLHRQITAL
jgi:hypothetical protein